MKTFLTLLKYELFNVLRGRWLIFYALLFAGFVQALLQFGGDSSKATVSVMNVVLLVVPIVSVLFPSIYWYNSEGFTSLLLTQPLRRRWIFLARWTAISFALAASFALGTFLPIAINRSFDERWALLIGLGSLLTVMFVSVGLFLAAHFIDRMKGIGAAFMAWFYFAIVHDALVFVALVFFRNYPLEIPSMILTALNPIDLVRVTLLMSLDASAMMGYTGAVLQKFLGSAKGFIAIAIAMSVWMGLPMVLGTRQFARRDF